MSLAIYRKYRPQKFDDVVGQKPIIQIIQNSLKLGRISHAYLLVGQRGTGKTTIARLLSKAINCLDSKDLSEPCGECQNCREIQNNQFLDLVEIDGASNRGIDEIRDLKEGIKFSPVKGKYKIFIIDEVHMLTKEAFNALLKTLEEPPAHAIFILATTEPQKLPETIISRTQRFDFKRISADDITDRLMKIAELEKVKMGSDVAREIAILAEGSLRDAESNLDQLISLGHKEITSEILEQILGRVNFESIMEFCSLLSEKETKKAIDKVGQFQNMGVDMMVLSVQILNIIRQIILLKISPETEEIFAKELSDNQLEKIKEISNKFEVSHLKKLLDLFIKAKEMIKNSPIPTLPLEIIIIENHNF